MFCNNCGDKHCDTCKLKYPKLLTTKIMKIRNGKCSCCGIVSNLMSKKSMCVDCFSGELAGNLV